MTIQTWAAALGPVIEPGDSASRKVAKLNRFFFGELGFTADGALHSRDALLPDRVIRQRRGYCVGLAAVYLALARELGLPVKGVATPSHLFVRYDDGIDRLNIELLNRGIPFPDPWYIRQYKIPEESVERGVFLRSLDDREVVGYIYANLGSTYSMTGDFTNSIVLYHAALRESSRLPVAYYNLGNDFLALGRFHKAIKAFGRALRLYPTDVWALNNRGLAFRRSGSLSKARRDFEAALALDPTFSAAKENLFSLEDEERNSRP